MWLATLALSHALAFDHTHSDLASFLKGAVSPAGVDYDALKGRRAVLDRYLEQVRAAEIDGWSKPQRLALYVNAYNAYTLKLMLDHGPPHSIRDLDGGNVWQTRSFVVAGESVTLNDLEHGKARKLADGRVHAVVNCASKGCPPLPAAPLTPDGYASQLDAATRTWARTNAFTISGDTVKLSQIFDWYAEDFASANQGDLAGVDGRHENALWFLSRYVDDATRQKLLSGTLSAEWQPYDWTLNQR